LCKKKNTQIKTFTRKTISYKKKKQYTNIFLQFYVKKKERKKKHIFAIKNPKITNNKQNSAQQLL
jgi:hypothetical protein